MIAIAASATAGNAQPFDHAKLAVQARQAFIIPGYVRLQVAIARLSTANTTLCQTPSQAKLRATQRAFRNTIAAWSRIEIVSFGPIAAQNRLERLFFWPDRKGIGQRQIRRLLAAQDANVIGPKKLATKSVAVQGLTALEFLLHGTGAEMLATSPADSFRCRFAQGVATNLAVIVREILTAWSDDGAYTKLWSSPGPGNPVYLNPSETTLELIKAFDQTLLSVRERRIVPAIGFGPKRRVFRPVLWRSGLGMVLIDGNIRGARDLFTKGSLADAYVASQKQSDPSAVSAIASLDTEFKFLLSVTGELAALRFPFKQKTTRNRLIGTGFPLKNIRAQAVARIKRAAGLSIGFNASDGD